MSPTTTTREGKIAAGLLVAFYAALLPPGLLLANEPTLVFGQSLMYVWSTAWGLFGILALVWAARVDAFAITESQVPPELRDREDVATATDLEDPARGEA